MYFALQLMTEVIYKGSHTSSWIQWRSFIILRDESELLHVTPLIISQITNGNYEQTLCKFVQSICNISEQGIQKSAKLTISGEIVWTEGFIFKWVYCLWFVAILWKMPHSALLCLVFPCLAIQRGALGGSVTSNPAMHCNFGVKIHCVLHLLPAAQSR